MQEIVTRVADGDDVVVTLVRKDHYKVPYYMCMVEENKIIDDTKMARNIMGLFREMSHTAHWLIWALVAVRNKQNNMAVFSAKDNIEAKKVTKAYKELHSLGLIRRIKRQHYLINPNAFLPLFEEYDTVVRVWKKAAGDK